MSWESGAADSEEMANSGPSLDSEDPQERIQARRLRIAAKIEAKRREALGEDPASILEQHEEPRKSYKQIEDSRQRLGKLVNDGTQLVTNIQIAVDARETQRRVAEEELGRIRVEKINSEAKSSYDKFQAISKKWLLNGEKKIPQELWALLNTQQQLCAQLIEDKNKLIGELQQELKRKDDQYVKDLKKQAEDIDLLIERMEDQVKSLIKTYREELLQIEKSFEQERRELLEKNRKKWEQGMQARRDKELESILNRMKKVEEYEKQLNQLRVQDGEEYNIIKIKLETDVQILQQQLQHLKATFQLNQEKLEYNFQVLKKRDEENAITKSQQKRKITRSQDVLNNLRIKLDKQIKQYKEENQSLTDDFKRIVEQYKELQKKMRHFAAVDAKKFHDIWVMNEEEMKQLIQRALEADRIIQEQQLGLPWIAPELQFLENIGPLVPKPKQQKTASELVQEVMAATATDERRDPVKSDDESTIAEPQPFSRRTVKQILELLCDESGFLIERKLLQLLSPLEKDDRSLMKLDSIFGALWIEVEDDVYKLVRFFMKYRQHVPEDLHSPASPSLDLQPSVSPSGDLQPASPSGDLQPLASPSGDLHPLASPSGDLHPLASPSGDLHPLASPSGDLHPPASPSGDLHPPASPSGDLQPPESPSSGLHHLGSPSGDFYPPGSPSGDFHPPGSHSGDLQPPASPSGDLQPPGSHSGDLQPPASPSGDLQPPASPSGDLHPPASPSSYLMHPNDVLRALRAFTMEYHQPREKVSQVRPAESEVRDSSEDAAYWKEAAYIIPESRLKVWDALESAMEKYHDVLSSRAQLITETSGLRQQNGELRMLLHQYLNSKINAELEIPPTQVMKVEFIQS